MDIFGIINMILLSIIAFYLIMKTHKLDFKKINKIIDQISEITPRINKITDTVESIATKVDSLADTVDDINIPTVQSVANNATPNVVQNASRSNVARSVRRMF
jgi:methyl-accepting chemotaxis protein